MKNINNNKGDYQSLEDTISLANEALDNVIETNDLENAIQMLEPFAQKGLYHSSLRTILIILNSGLTLKKEDLERAQRSADQTYYLSNKLRRNGFFTSLVKMFKTPNYNKYTDMELHAELIYAKFLGMSAILCALEAQNIYSLMKIAYRLRLCVNAFKECRQIMWTRTKWESESSRQHFEAGVRFANGLQHLCISHIPPKLLKIVNFLGYKGVERRGFQELNKTAFELPGISSRMAQIVLLFYRIAAEPHACLGPKDLTLTQHMIDKELKRFPKSLLYLLAKGKLQQISGRVDEAIETFKNCLIDNKLEISHKVFHLELMFCYALKCQWTECVERGQLVREQAIHSPSIITYLVAIFCYAKYMDENDPQVKQLASDLFRAVPAMRIRYFGKTITIEKSAVEVSKMYFRNNETLVLPQMDALYSGNYISFIKNNELLLNKHMKRIDKQVIRFEEDLNNSNYLDNYLTALFYKAVILKLMGRFSEAKDCLNTILKEESRFEFNFSIPAQAVLELGLIELAQDNTDEAQVWLDKAVNDYSGYLNENYVHLRAYAALRELGVNTDKQSEDQSKFSEYGKEWLNDLEVEENTYENMLKNDKLVLM